MCVDCVLASSRIAQVDPGDGPPPEVVLSQCGPVMASLRLGLGLLAEVQFSIFVNPRKLV
jgi:hypothetical protein